MRFSFAIGMIDDLEPFAEGPREQTDRHRYQDRQVLEKHVCPPSVVARDLQAKTLIWRLAKSYTSLRSRNGITNQRHSGE